MEARLLSLAKEADRATLANGTHPPLPALPEPDVADMEFFLDQLQILLPVLGFSFARPLPTLEDENPSVPKEVSPTFCMSPVGTQATAREVNGEFVVKKGSTARVGGVASWTSYRTLRDKLVQEGKLVPDEGGGLYVFAEDVPFASPSAAAAVVFAGNQNGRLPGRLGQRSDVQGVAGVEGRRCGRGRNHLVDGLTTKAADEVVVEGVPSAPAPARPDNGLVGVRPRAPRQHRRRRSER